MSKKMTTLYLTVSSYQRLKELVSPKPVSQEIDELIEKRLAELANREYDPTEHVDYEALKKEYMKVVGELDRLEKRLKDGNVYEDMKKVTVKVGVDTKNYTNVREVSGEFLRQWKGSREHAHLCISLLECVQRKHEIERQLEAIRL